MPTKQPPSSEVIPVPADRLMAFQESVADTGTVVITRDIGLIGGGCFLGVLIDGQLSAKLDTGERAVFHLPAGEHLLAPTWVKGKGLCGAFFDDERASARRRAAEVNVKPGVSKSYRIHTNTDGESIIEPVM
jgi:hypothetical protein